MNPLVTIYTSMSLPEIYMIKNLLEAENIFCLTKDELITQTAPYITNITNGIQLQVRTNDIERAVEILQESGYLQPKIEANPSKWPTIIFIIILILVISLIFWMNQKNS